MFNGRFALVVEDRRRDYGEQRFDMLVEMFGIVLNVTSTPRPSKYQIISARLANRKERRADHARRQDG
ncbi:hypothetical protein BGCPKDLD_1143 [Methylorubrum suomiense]|uniref:Uncharacterized protein n=1 Tax=Methylorubrum suomiense TaxID=144191 RepID=A0ABQ4UV46_9HYPH|nr:hypothetical protein BGCPKDLD_1143 [Methylorubrum suomiense]